MTNSFYIDVLDNNNDNPYNNIYFNNLNNQSKNMVRRKYNLPQNTRFNTNLTNRTLKVSSVGTGYGSKKNIGFKTSKKNRYNKSSIFNKKKKKKKKKIPMPKINKKSPYLGSNLKLKNNVLFDNDFRKGLITQRSFKKDDLLFILFKKIDNHFELTPIGDTVNFSNEPNTDIKQVNNMFFAKAVREIAIGEEITSSFNGLSSNLLKYKLN